MRMLTAYYDDESGELKRIKWSEKFLADTALLRADVLKDLLHILGGCYYDAVEEAYHGPGIQKVLDAMGAADDAPQVKCARHTARGTHVR